MILAYLAAAAVALLGYSAKALSGSGAIAACIVGGTVLGFGGWAWAILLGLFFASSSALSFFRRSDLRKRRAAETFDKGGRRDAAQVLANGGVGALSALLSFFVPPHIASILFCGYVGSLAAATADTWATEIGVLSRYRPHLITTFRPVEAGTSGGVTWLGSAASVAGALFMGVSATLFTAFSLFGAPFVERAGGWEMIGAGLAGGVSGALADSLLGATIQASFRCPRCDKTTESRIHNCGTRTQLVRGVLWVSNDLVNLAATLTGALVGGALCWVLYN
ncbi:MAG TPA: DUF92 domain-containing protein [Chloroflexia bacterium]|nr:DUF92 domain-containing protein [Chloroflexia bacterium]